ncbi:shikimate dehydrogenase [Methylotenera sp.]|uniref:shikimate dehydrogenase n=1 Tax=Methylotenera sp. TaxID=2051956 RepID=UPI002489B41E|nr:shikimate dehydrogenase [Methylotenera sp.]MDI1360820.1 shikimate dehydrogenase [Methylotenera sp.]
MTDKYAVIGNPISHSKSPLIHEAFAKQTNQDISYERILAPLDGFELTVRDLIASGYKGANVTVPFKFEAYKICDSLSARVISSGSGAVNTLINIHGKIHGDNTDGVGLRNDIEKNLKFLIADKNILILGAGGAAYGVLNSLIGAKSITIANRTSEKALQLVMSISDVNEARAKMFEELDAPYDLIINATSTGLTDTALPIPNIIFSKDCLAYDMMYGRETPFMKQARENGALVADGLGMLVEQAAEAFYLWCGVRPETQSVIQQIRNLA